MHSKALQSMEPSTFYFMIICSVTISSVLPYCYFATHLFHKMKMSSHRIYEVSWYKLEVRQQRDLNFLLKYTQQEREIKGFDFVSCSLQTFLRVHLFLLEVEQ